MKKDNYTPLGLGTYYSGGGCKHYSKEVEGTELIWLINKTDPEQAGDPDFNIPYDNFDGSFVYSIDLADLLNEEELTDKIISIVSEYEDANPYAFRDGYFYFGSDTFLEGMRTVLEMSDKITKVVKTNKQRSNIC